MYFSSWNPRFRSAVRLGHKGGCFLYSWRPFEQSIGKVVGPAPWGPLIFPTSFRYAGKRCSFSYPRTEQEKFSHGESVVRLHHVMLSDVNQLPGKEVVDCRIDYSNFLSLKYYKPKIYWICIHIYIFRHFILYIYIYAKFMSSRKNVGIFLYCPL